MDNFMIAHILKFLHPRLALKLSLINRTWRDVIRDEQTWKAWLQAQIPSKDQSLLLALIRLRSDSTQQITSTTPTSNILNVLKRSRGNNGTISTSYKDIVLDYIIRKRDIQFTTVVGRSFSFHNSYVVQETETSFMRCDKSYILDIYLGGWVDGGEIGVTLRPSKNNTITFKYDWTGVVSVKDIASILNSATHIQIQANRSHKRKGFSQM